MCDLTPEQIDRIESAHGFYERADGVAKARLLAALAADVPPRTRSLWKTRAGFMRRNVTRVALAAALVAAAVGVVQLAQPKSLFALTIRAMVEAKGYACDLVEVQTADGDKEVAKSAARLFWAATGEQRLESIEPRAVEIRRPGETGLELWPETKEYSVLPRTYAREFSFGLFGRLGEYRGTGAPSEVREIRGRKAELFVVPWSRVIGDEQRGDAQMRMWLDAGTALPVRVDLAGFGPKGEWIFRLENFRWGDQDKGLFDMKVPAGYVKRPVQDFKTEQITEYVVLGLSTFAKYNGGRYPAVKYVYGDEQGEALRKLMGMGAKAQGWVKPEKDLKWADPKAGEFAHGSYGMSWINSLQRDHPECVYNGRTVSGKDAGKVLLRWKLDDDGYRVIYGDLRAESVSAERLKELEAK